MTTQQITQIFSQLATDFQDQYKVSRETAAHMVGLFASVVALTGEETQAQDEFERRITQAFKDGEAWAAEYFEASLETRYPQAATICETASKVGTSPILALQAVYGIEADVATELARLISRRS
ncbi:hypothetical protein [Streptomyces nitrosporeus]|uniref:hypothetical protein n=1 Tax=Streptomyces nitrosporeus TaxID=28894 RepID=UPI00167DFEB5|nr:hypothetical protein [Streptomyces nitrosporeus]GGZ19679.1 hypothetical protein GCM10010327_58520 [Streptomyces nitrosporeus]